MEIINHQSKHGINTLLIKDPSAKTASIQFWFRAGSALEKKNDQGIAHFLEHMFFKGTKKRPGYQIAKEVESFGGDINAFTSFDFTCYYINSPGSKTATCVDILCDMVCRPSFLEKDFPAERQVVLEEFKRSIDSPNQYNFSKIQKSFFSQGYDHQILGNEKTIKNFSKLQLTNFRNKYYNKENSLLIIAGPSGEVEKSLKEVDKYIMPSGEHSKFLPLKVSKNKALTMHEKQTAMCTLTLVSESSNFSSEAAPFEDFIMGVLGFGETSRLYSKLVIDTNLANSANCSSMFMTEGGVHFLKITFEKKNLEKITKILLQEIKELIKNGVTDKEVERLKKLYLSSKVYDMETTEAFAFSKGHGYAQNGDINSEDKFIERFQSISTEELNRNIYDFFPKKWQMSAQVPKGTKENQIAKVINDFNKKLTLILDKRPKKLKIEKPFSDFDPSVTHHKLKNGIHLIHKHNKMVKTFAFHTYLKGGLTDETLKNNSSYHFITSLLNASANKKSKFEIKNYFEQKAVSYSTFSGKNAYGTTLNGMAVDFQEVFPQYAECLIKSDFKNSELSKEKTVSKRILKAEKKDPTRSCFKKLSQYLFQDHPYGLSPIGTVESISKITTTNLKKIHEKNLKNSPIVFCYSGPDSPTKVVETINANLGLLKPRPDLRKLKSKSIKIKKSSFHHIPFDREQTQIFIGYQTKTLSNKENLAIKILQTILGGQSSRLFTEVRDQKGLCYSVQPIYFNAMEGGYFGIYMASSNEKVEEAVSSINNILNEFKENGIGKSEFSDAKEMILGQFEMNLQTNDDFIGIYGVPFLHGKSIDFYYEQNILIKNIKRVEINELIKKVLSRPIHVVLCGDNF